MTNATINSGRALAVIAERYEQSQDWLDAIEAHKNTLSYYERAISNEHDPLTRQTLNALKEKHRDRIKAIAKEQDITTSGDNVFDMRKLEQELFAIQKGANVGESYAMVPNDGEDDDEDEEEDEDEEYPFNKFWGVVEPMVNKLSLAPSAPSSPSLQPQPPVLHNTTVDEKEADRIQREMLSISESFFTLPQSKQESYTHPCQSTAKQENEKLRAQLADLKSQIQSLEKKNIDSTALKSSIIQFKNDVHKQALRIMQTQESTIMTRSAITTGSPLHKNIRHVGSSTAEIMSRIKELEDANKTLRSQNRKQDALVNKYKERWERLKEGAKKRQPSTAPMPTGNKNSTLLSSLASNNPPVILKTSSSASKE